MNVAPMLVASRTALPLRGPARQSWFRSQNLYGREVGTVRFVDLLSAFSETSS